MPRWRIAPRWCLVAYSGSRSWLLYMNEAEPDLVKVNLGGNFISTTKHVLIFLFLSFTPTGPLLHVTRWALKCESGPVQIALWISMPVRDLAETACRMLVIQAFSRKTANVLG